MNGTRILRTIGLLAALAAAACGHRSASPEAFDVTLYAPRYAAGFEIVGAEDAASTIIRVRDPWQGAEGIETQLFIARDGERAPEGFDGQVLDGDARRVVCMSSTHVAMLDAVDAVQRIVGVSGIGFIANEWIAGHRDTVGDVGYDGNIDYELIVALDPDLVLLYGVSGASGLEPKLRELGIPFVYIGEYLEESPLGKAEWLVAVAETVGRRAEAERIFPGIAGRYEALAEQVAACTASGTSAAGQSGALPRVLLNTPYRDTWFIPSEQSYQVRLIRDAGGDTFTAPGEGNASRPIDMETAILYAEQADVWFISGSVPTLAALKAQLPRFADMTCVSTGNVWNCDRRTTPGGGNDYWESGVVYPDRVLHDLVAILHPELLLDARHPFDAELHYYRRIE